MDGKRFGVGLAAGIMLGLAVIAGSGGLGIGPVFLAPTASQNLAAVTTTASTSTLSSTTPSVIFTATPGNITKAVTTGSSTSTTPSFNSTTPYSSGSSGLSFAALPSPRLSSVATQPVQSNAVILVPVVMAFVLGALLYRASIRKSDQNSEERPSPGA